MKVSDLMTSKVATVPASASLADAARLMWEFDCGIIPVVGDNNTLRGVVTDRDICMGGLTQAKPLQDIPVLVSMASALHTCRPSDDVAAVHALMRKHQIRRLPVVDDKNRVEGLLSLSDLAASAQDANGGARKQQEVQLAESLADICEPRHANGKNPTVPQKERSEPA